MATGLRHLKLSIKRRIISTKSNYLKPSLSRSEIDSTNRTTWSFCKVIQVENGEIKTGISTSVIKYQPTNCALQIRCISVLKPSSLEETQKTWDIENNESLEARNPHCEDENWQRLPCMIQLHPVSEIMPLVHCMHTYDSLNLPVKIYNHCIDDMHLEDNCNVVSSNTSLVETPVSIFSGYLDSSRYYMYCLGMKEHCSFTLSDYEHHFVSTAYDMNQNKSKESSGRATEEQLKTVYLKLSNSLPKLFVEPFDYSIYHRDVVFQNNIRGVTTNGLAAYVQQMALIRILAHIRYAHVKMEILKITQHVEDGTVRVRWRVTGISGLRVLFFFWRFKLWEWKKMMDKEKEWIDGFSIFHIGSDGLVYKHVCDKMMPDEEKVDAKPSDVAVKFALLLGLVPRPSELGMNVFVNSNTFIQQQLPCSQQ